MGICAADRNQICLHGRVGARPVFSHANHGVEFYRFPLAVRRLSGVEDRIHILASRPLLEQAGNLSPEQELTVTGEVRTFNNRGGAARRGSAPGGGGGGLPRCPLGGRRGGWERPLRALLGPQGSASSGRGGGVRTTGQGTGTAWSREPRSPPSVGTTWRSQKGLAFGLKALTAPPLC